MQHSVPDGMSSIELINVDCMEYMRSLPDNAFDIAVTSPPYNQLHQSGGGFVARSAYGETLKGGYNGNSDNMPEADYQQWMQSVLKELQRVCKGLVWINHKVRYRDGVGIHPLHFYPSNFYSEVIWDRGSSMVLNANKYAPSHEHIYGFGKPHFWDRKNDTAMSVWRIHPTPQGLDHPCPFPSIIAERLIISSCPPDGTVFDPFAGSGTTGIAAINAGRSFVGCEIDAKYASAAIKRLADHSAQPRLFEPETPKPTQLSIDEAA